VHEKKIDYYVPTSITQGRKFIYQMTVISNSWKNTLVAKEGNEMKLVKKQQNKT